MNTQRGGKRRDKGLQGQINDGNEARDNGNVGRDTDLRGDEVPQGGDQHVGTDEDCGNRQTHADAVKQAGGDGEGGAHTQQLNQHRVLVEQALFELFLEIHSKYLLNPALPRRSARH